MLMPFNVCVCSSGHWTGFTNWSCSSMRISFVFVNLHCKWIILTATKIYQCIERRSWSYLDGVCSSSNYNCCPSLDHLDFVDSIKCSITLESMFHPRGLFVCWLSTIRFQTTSAPISWMMTRPIVLHVFCIWDIVNVGWLAVWQGVWLCGRLVGWLTGWVGGERIEWFDGSRGRWCEPTDRYPDSKINGANMGPTWDREDPGGPHVGPMNNAIWLYVHRNTDTQMYMQPDKQTD